MARVYLDSCIIIYLHEATADLQIAIRDRLLPAAALVGGCEQFWTNDNRLAKVQAGIAIEVLP